MFNFDFYKTTILKLGAKIMFSLVPYLSKKILKFNPTKIKLEYISCKFIDSDIPYLEIRMNFFNETHYLFYLNHINFSLNLYGRDFGFFQFITQDEIGMKTEISSRFYLSSFQYAKISKQENFSFGYQIELFGTVANDPAMIHFSDFIKPETLRINLEQRETDERTF